MYSIYDVLYENKTPLNTTVVYAVWYISMFKDIRWMETESMRI